MSLRNPAPMGPDTGDDFTARVRSTVRPEHWRVRITDDVIRCSEPSCDCVANAITSVDHNFTAEDLIANVSEHMLLMGVE